MMIKFSPIELGYVLRVTTKDNNERWVHPSLSAIKFQKPDELISFNEALAIGNQVIDLDYIQKVVITEVRIREYDIDLNRVKMNADVLEKLGFDITKMGGDNADLEE